MLTGETGVVVVVYITDQGVLTDSRPELTEEGLQLFDVGGGGGDDVVTATAGRDKDYQPATRPASLTYLCCCFA